MSSFTASPNEKELPEELGILDPVSPNSSDIDNASPIVRERYNDTSEDGCIQSTISNGAYSIISSNQEYLNHMHYPSGHNSDHHPGIIVPVSRDFTPSFTPSSPPYTSHSNHSYLSSQFYLPQHPPSSIHEFNGNRSIYLGNLHPNTTVEEIANNVRAGGLVESINYLPEKRVCFITFVDAVVAHKFYVNHQVLHQLVIHGYDIVVGWAKQHSGPLHRDIALAVTAGASRNVYIGIKPNRDENGFKPMMPSEDELREDFSKIGELEQINFYHNKDCGFLNFVNITDAIAVVEAFESDEMDGVYRLSKALYGNQDHANQFYHKYKEFKISYAKDRCGNQPKFSFRKKPNGSQGSTYQQYQEQLHSSLRKYNKDKFTKTRYSESSNARDANEPLSDEAAMIFGIVNNSVQSNGTTNGSLGKEQTHSTDKTLKKQNGSSSNGATDRTRSEHEHAGNQLEMPTIEESKETITEEQPEKEKAGEAEAEEEDDEAEEEEEEDDDDDEDVSIIIGSEDMSFSFDRSEEKERSKAPNSKNTRYAQRKLRKQYQNNYDKDYADLHRGKVSRSSSNVLLSSSVNYQYSPYIQPQSVYYFPLASRNSSTSSFRTNRSQHSQKWHSTLPQGNAGYPIQPVPYPQQVFAMQQQPGQYHGQQYPQIRYIPVIQNQVVSPNLQAPSYNLGEHRSSGSEVMAQYLAKTQRNQMIYEPVDKNGVERGTPGKYSIRGKTHHNGLKR
ncbi:hypothetical protein LELG_01888 [Lodderomyces elongisporus NRRL YB-4239]|uniref:RRM domain-containing protein n=1 Tax=Lodderomyces elongisporus (strain ATCC 11503 / CBS 2605 / JCM 1781 / NBRC 1676 / NRRL YB-4239) TaxID=379508 RepID=A5DX01_LODEL|nr:hypothetical protein LELG_01888 [Lodderomyces elongisporus NRRL YB-4239]